jgi:predicted MFS family arabinose efflux permease
MAIDSALRRPRRWAVLFAFTVVAGVSQMLWLNFAPLLTLVQNRYGVGEGLASALIFVFPLLYVALSIPAGAMVDRLGYRLTVGAGATLMAIAAAVRILDHSFAFLLAGQIGIAVAQPYVVNGISKLVADWFAEDHAAIATGLGTVGMFLGMAVGLAATPPLEASLGLRGAMVVFTAIAAASAVLFWLVVVPNERGPATTMETRSHFAPLLANPGIRVLLVLSFLGLGVFNGLTTWLEQILAFRGIDAESAGLVGGVLILGGIVGAIAIPAVSDALHMRKPFLVVCSAAGLLLLYPLCSTGMVSTLIAIAAALGMLFLPAYPLLLEMSAQIAGPASAGAATSLLMLAGNAGGVAVVLLVPVVKGDGPDYGPAVIFMTALLLVTVLLALIAPETFPRAQRRRRRRTSRH